MAYETYTIEDFRTSLSEMVEGVPFWDDFELQDAINEALLLYNLLTGYWRARYTTTTDAGNFDYAVPETLLYQCRVLFVGQVLEPISLFHLTNCRPNWRTETTATAGVPDRPIFWVPLSPLLIALWPTPAAGGDILTIDGIAATPQITDDTPDSNFINLGEEQFHVILGYALHLLAFKEASERTFATAHYQTAFLAHCAEHNGQLKASALFRRYLGLDSHPRPTRLETA